MSDQKPLAVEDFRLHIYFSLGEFAWFLVKSLLVSLLVILLVIAIEGYYSALADWPERVNSVKK